MEIRIKFFAALREIIGKDEIEIEWMEGMTDLTVKAFLQNTFFKAADLFDQSLMAINGKYAESNILIMPDDEIAILPPVSGG